MHIILRGVCLGSWGIWLLFGVGAGYERLRCQLCYHLLHYWGVNNTGYCNRCMLVICDGKGRGCTCVQDGGGVEVVLFVHAFVVLMIACV